MRGTTGQDHPGTGVTARGEQTYAVDIASVVKGIGIQNVEIVDGYDISSIERALKSFVELEEPCVIVVRRACPLNVKFSAPPPKVDPERCDGCGACL
ncbi:MAG: indolepyruvate ferredoxin oxidoreductase subunit alpha, partial [Firmicutes bacterium]|nr:indolepyruvate ferredoxin oxidoreductase subunit alpha [Bacillota bacterium]